MGARDVMKARVPVCLCMLVYPCACINVCEYDFDLYKFYMDM